MFTGIIESMGTVEGITASGTNKTFMIQSAISTELKVDQSLAHNGVCLTVEACDERIHKVTAIKETLDKSNLADLKKGDLVNLERCMKLDGRLDGHIVQGHVDDTALCTEVKEEGGSWFFRFNIDDRHKGLIIPKGSITVNGTSLTIVDANDDNFSVAIIPFTYEHTNFNQIKKGDRVNIEFDILGKYILRNLSLISK